MTGSVSSRERGEEQRQQVMAAVSSLAFRAGCTHKLADAPPTERVEMHAKCPLCARYHESFTNSALAGSEYIDEFTPVSWSTFCSIIHRSRLALSVIEGD